MRGHSFLDKSLRLDGIVDILECLQETPLYYTPLLKKSKIQFKVAFRKYLDFCISKKFVETYHAEDEHTTDRWGQHLVKITRKYYIVTQPGIEWLRVTKDD